MKWYARQRPASKPNEINRLKSKNMSNKGGRPKGSRDVAPKVRFIVDNAIEKLGMNACIDMLVNEIQENGLAVTLPKLSAFFPKEMDITTTNLTPEQWLEAMSDAGKPESNEPADTLPGRVH